MAKKINIIGAGIAGLSAGCYLQMKGYETEIFELHNLPGGLCTSWERKGYTFDGCIHWLVGSSPRSNFYNLWNELLDMKSIEFVENNEYLRVEDQNGKMIRVFTDIDQLEQEMLEKAPEDKGLIIEFINAARKLKDFEIPIEKAPETMNLLEGIKLMLTFFPYMRTFKKWLKIPTSDFARKCKNPLLKKTFESMFLPEMSVLFLIMTVVWMHKKSAGYPIGGSLNFSRLIEKSYLDLGGKIQYNSRVKKIVTKDKSVVSIQLENNEFHEADIVISAADGYSTIFEMLEGKYVNKKIHNYYENFKPFPSFLQLSIGISGTFPEIASSLVFPLKKDIVIDPETTLEDIGIRIFNFDPTMAPKGKTVLTSLIPTFNYKYWNDLRKHQTDQYKAEKQRITDEIIDALEIKMGNFKKNIEVTDLSTPATVIRYTNNWKGSLEGWLLTPEVGLKQMKKVLPGLKNFYMTGQWVEPGGGLPPAIMSGRNVTQIICKRDKKKFRTTKKS